MAKKNKIKDKAWHLSKGYAYVGAPVYWASLYGFKVPPNTAMWFATAGALIYYNAFELNGKPLNTAIFRVWGD